MTNLVLVASDFGRRITLAARGFDPAWIAVAMIFAPAGRQMNAIVPHFFAVKCHRWHNVCTSVMGNLFPSLESTSSYGASLLSSSQCLVVPARRLWEVSSRQPLQGSAVPRRVVSTPQSSQLSCSVEI